jgi:hypothetical protein
VELKEAEENTNVGAHPRALTIGKVNSNPATPAVIDRSPSSGLRIGFCVLSVLSGRPEEVGRPSNSTEFRCMGFEGQAEICGYGGIPLPEQERLLYDTVATSGKAWESSCAVGDHRPGPWLFVFDDIITSRFPITPWPGSVGSSAQGRNQNVMQPSRGEKVT